MPVRAVVPIREERSLRQRKSNGPRVFGGKLPPFIFCLKCGPDGPVLLDLNRKVKPLATTKGLS